MFVCVPQCVSVRVKLKNEFCIRASQFSSKEKYVCFRFGEHRQRILYFTVLVQKRESNTKRNIEQEYCHRSVGNFVFGLICRHKFANIPAYQDLSLKYPISCGFNFFSRTAVKTQTWNIEFPRYFYCMARAHQLIDADIKDANVIGFFPLTSNIASTKGNQCHFARYSLLFK